ncbi:MAG: ATP-binding protein, partial [Bacteroidota bacterium]
MGGKLSFKTHIQLKNIIGKELINNDNIALLELVKNSFDASSNRVSIAFLNIKKNDDPSLREGEYTPQTSRIIVSDDGQGMSLQDIRDKWLNIAYSEKKDTPKKKGRRMSGAKGIGRFSCDRLGEYLNLYARIEDAENYVLLKIDWNLFEIDNDINREIQSVILDYEFLSDSDLEK